MPVIEETLSKRFRLFTLSNTNGLRVKIFNYGGIITSILTPDIQGSFTDITLGFDKPEDYLTNAPYLGAIIGRYANRIAKAQFNLEGKTYKLANNDGQNHLHGGLKGFDKVFWDAEIKKEALELSHKSQAGEEGYPGHLEVRVTYQLSEDNDLQIDYWAKTDAPTVINLTNHSYFNLAGQGDSLSHKLMLNADRFTPVDEALIPTGELRHVGDTPFDFRQMHTIGGRIAEDNKQLTLAGGYDHNFVLNGDGLKLGARVLEESSGRTLELYTTQPGVQFYSGNMLPAMLGRGGLRYTKHSGFCLETQHFPDSPNQPAFPTARLNPDETYEHTTIFKFGVKN